MADIKNGREQQQEIDRLVAGKKFDQAFKLSQDLVKAFPQSFLIKLQYGRILKELKKLAEAEIIFAELRRQYPENLNLLLESGIISFQLHDNARASEFFNKVLFFDPFNLVAKEYTARIKKGETAPEEPPSAEELFLDNPVPVNEKEVEKIPVKEVMESKPMILINQGEESDLLKVPEPAKEDDKSEDLLSEAPVMEAPPPAVDNDQEAAYVTESAAELYLSQGHFAEALTVYEKLYQIKKDERFLWKIEEVNEKKKNQKKIDQLTKWLEGIIKQGEQFV